MEGVRILEVAQFTFVPAAGGVLADWGADVIKIEHVTQGDAQRGLKRLGAFNSDDYGVMPVMEHPNRGKRSLALDIAHPEGLELLYALARTSDVFLTNFLPAARRRLRIDVEHLRAQNPRIIYVRGSALGDRGPERECGGFDMSAYWCRAGTAASVTPPDVDFVPLQPPAYGDSIGAMTIAGGISGALFRRERSGEPSVVDVSLLSTGCWVMGLGIDQSLVSGVALAAPLASTQAAATNPLVGSYRTRDGRWLTLVMLQGYRYWADLCRHVDRPELAKDPRFDSAEKLMRNAAEAAELIQAAFAQRTLLEWRERLVTLEGQWAPVQNTLDVASDPQVRANGYIQPTQTADGRPFEMVTSPVQFDGAPCPVGRCPEFNEHGDEILQELGLDWDRILALKASGAVA
jgi:crotonobetainyl-CoA:carnitine CoA-transferase CaiB-like acyl-CoA transferase